jgi:hypothetical protein
MTVCIVASYNNGKGFVLASDQMLTLHYPMAYEYENEEFEKISKLSGKADIYCLSAGNAIFASEIIEETKQQVEKDSISSIILVAQKLRDIFKNYRLKRLVSNELETRGLSLEGYYKGHKVLLPDIVAIIDKTFRTYNLGVEFIVVGKDTSGCHIYTITHPGDIYCNDSIGYATIGIGAPHVMYYMIEKKYRKSANKKAVSKLVDEAKKRAEVAPGVGKKIKKIEVGED